jgi:hypothetical protein
VSLLADLQDALERGDEHAARQLEREALVAARDDSGLGHGLLRLYAEAGVPPEQRPISIFDVLSARRRERSSLHALEGES